MASIRPMWRGSSVIWTRSPQRRRIQSPLQMPLIAASRPERGLARTAPPRWWRASVRSSFEIVLRFGFIVLFVAFGTEFSKRLARIIERPHGVRLLVASPPVWDLLLFAKHLFVAARTVRCGLQPSCSERERLGFGRALGNHLKFPRCQIPSQLSVRCNLRAISTAVLTASSRLSV
jgi:hypothetical protein